MKKLTKKAVKEAATYMVQIDWKASYRDTLDVEVLDAKTLIDAMNEASDLFDENVYMLSILEKTGVVIDDNGLAYEEVLRSRSAGSWLTVQQDGPTRGCIWGRFFHDTYEGFDMIETSRS